MQPNHVWGGDEAHDRPSACPTQSSGRTAHSTPPPLGPAQPYPARPERPVQSATSPRCIAQAQDGDLNPNSCRTHQASPTAQPSPSEPRHRSPPEIAHSKPGEITSRNADTGKPTPSSRTQPSREAKASKMRSHERGEPHASTGGPNSSYERNPGRLNSASGAPHYQASITPRP